MSRPWRVWGTLQVPWNSEAVWLERLSEDGDSRLLVMGVECDGGRLAASGMLKAEDSTRCQHVWHLGMGVHANFQGAGVGTVMLAALLDAADTWLAARRVQLEVYDDNPRAIALYKRQGFAMEGTRRAEPWRAGGYADTHAMARLR